MQWSDLCQPPGDSHEQFMGRHRLFTAAWDAADRADRERKRCWWRWLRVVFVCSWKHGTRKVTDGVWESNYCWACTGRGQ
jgi:hypothetical protein